MIKFLQIINALLTVTVPIVAGVLLSIGGFFETQDPNGGAWVFWTAFLPVWLLIFFIEIINFIKKLYPEKFLPMISLICAPYILFAIEWIFFNLGIERFLMGSGAIYIITTLLGFAVAVAGGPWLTGAHRRYTHKEWTSYAVATGAQLFFILPGIVVLYKLIPAFLNSTDGDSNWIFLIGTIILNSITQTKYILARSLYSTKSMGPGRIS